MICRPTSAFLFLTLCIAAASLSACNAPPSDSAEGRVPVTSTADASLATDDIAYLTHLGLIRGHLRVGVDLYEKGVREHAKRHMKHPADELYAALTSASSAFPVRSYAVMTNTLPGCGSGTWITFKYRPDKVCQSPRGNRRFRACPHPVGEAPLRPPPC